MSSCVDADETSSREIWWTYSTACRVLWMSSRGQEVRRMWKLAGSLASYEVEVFSLPASRRRICSHGSTSLLLSNAPMTIRMGAATAFEAMLVGPMMSSCHCFVMSGVCLSPLWSQTACAKAHCMIGLQSANSLAIVVNILSWQQSTCRVQLKQKHDPRPPCSIYHLAIVWATADLPLPAVPDNYKMCGASQCCWSNSEYPSEGLAEYLANNI